MANGRRPEHPARKLAALRALFASQREHGRISQNPADLVSTPRRPPTLPRVLSAREAAAAARRHPGVEPAGAARPRDVRAGLLVRAARRGDRVAERGDVDHDAEQLRVEGKGRKTRFVPVGEPALAAVSAVSGAWPRRRSRARRRLRRRTRAGGRAALFLSKTGRPLGTSDVRRRLRTWTRARRRRRRLLAARAAPQLRHAPARRRGGPAQHPGAARARERVEHPDLHSGRVREAQKRLCAQSPSGLIRGR